MEKMVEYEYGKSRERRWGIPEIMWNIFGITFEPETLETWSRALKTSIFA